MTMAKQDDGLFLLEVLVDKVVFLKSPCFTDNDFRTCVKIECPAVDPLIICDDDPGSTVARSAGPFVKRFNSGKSCLFSLKQSDISDAMNRFPVKITVFKSLPCGCLPTKIIMGQATIDMTKEFIQARNKFLADPTSVNHQALKDSFRIRGPDGAETGEVIMFLRISCFGKLIITKFQGGNGPTNIVGAAAGSNMVDYPPRKTHSRNNPCVYSAITTNSDGGLPSQKQPSSGSIITSIGNVAPAPCGAPVRPGQSSICPPPMQDEYSTMPCQDNDEPCYCTGTRTDPKSPLDCRNTDKYCLHVPKGPTKLFEEIGTNLGGNELKIRVPAKSATFKKISQTHCALMRPYVKPDTQNKAKQGDDEGPCKPPCAKNQISLALPAEDICCRGVKPQGTQFSCTTEGCAQTSKHGQQAAFARGDGRTDLVNRDVFVLKVAKTAMYGDKKTKLELELTTPKGGDKPPPPGRIDAKIDTDPICACCAPKKFKSKGKKKQRSPMT